MLDKYGLDGTVDPGTMAFLQIHVDAAYGTPWGYSRANRYDVEYTPTTWFDGVIGYVGSTSSSFQSRFNTRRAVSTDVTLELAARPGTGQTYVAELDICMEPGGVERDMNIVLAQLLDHWPAGSHHRNGFKQASSPYAVHLAPGQCAYIEHAFTFDSNSWSSRGNAKFIAWAEEDVSSGPAEIYQATVIGWPFPSGDCNENGIVDTDDLLYGTCTDCDGNYYPDQCEVAGNDCNSNSIHDACDALALVTGQPLDQLGCSGGEFTLNVTAPGAESYQWYKDGNILYDGGDISGATSSELTIENMEAADEGDYTCAVDVGCLHGESLPATVQMVVPAAITDQSDPSVMTCDGNTALFFVEADGTGLTYQWSKDGVPLANDGRITGAMGPSLTVKDVTLDDLGDYACYVADPCGGWDETDPSTLGLHAGFSLEPVDTCAEPGGTAVLSVSVVADPPSTLVSHYWKKGEDYLSDGGNISGSYTDTLTISSLSESDIGTYSCTIWTADCLFDSAEVRLQVSDCDACSDYGDMDADGDYDLADLHRFCQCFAADVTVTTDCVCANVDYFNDVVDLDDWTLLQEQLLTGPQ